MDLGLRVMILLRLFVRIRGLVILGRVVEFTTRRRCSQGIWTLNSNEHDHGRRRKNRSRCL